jgi:GR25 family glycosyltransferase involved in LPS biosynthesis
MYVNQHMIDVMYYINLDKRPDRNEHFLNECNKARIPMSKVKRFTGLDGDTYSFQEEHLALFKKSDFMSVYNGKKLMGNQLSHYFILKEMVEKKYNSIVIFQDDVVFRHDFMFQLNKVMKNIPDDAEIINIGFHKYAANAYFVAWDLRSTDDFHEIGSLKVNESVCHLKHGINPCSLAYIVTLKGAICLIDYFEKNGFLRATDGNYNDYLTNKHIFYGTNTVLCTGNPQLGSDIF